MLEFRGKVSHCYIYVNICIYALLRVPCFAGKCLAMN
jgi:hypothetical protein